MTRPLAHLNLRYNPFGELDPHERAEVAVGRLAEIASQIGPNTVVQLRAPCGRGKTSHLLGLTRVVPNATYVRADQAPVVVAGTVLLDEADLVHPVRRAWLLRKASGIVVGTHRDLSLFSRLLGRKTVDIVVSDGSPEHILRIATRRIEAARIHDAPVPILNFEEAKRLSQRFGDNQRAVEDHLYAAIQSMKEVGPVQV